jgi:hypothetical protein
MAKNIGSMKINKIQGRNEQDYVIFETIDPDYLKIMPHLKEMAELLVRIAEGKELDWGYGAQAVEMSAQSRELLDKMGVEYQKG